MKAKKAAAIMLCAALGAAMVTGVSVSAKDKDELVLYTWDGMVPQEVLDDENALSNTEEVGYTSTVKSAFEEMKNGTYEGIDSYIPQIDNPKNEIFAYQKPKIKQKFAELWTKVKAK